MKRPIMREYRQGRKSDPRIAISMHGSADSWQRLKIRRKRKRFDIGNNGSDSGNGGNGKMPSVNETC